MTGTERARSLKNLELERDAIVLYENLAQIERDPHRAAAFRMIAGNERRHAEIWARKLQEAGQQLPPAKPASRRIRFILVVARLFGTRAVSDLVRSLEGEEEEAYAGQATPEVAAIAADEREHAHIWRRLEGAPAGREVIRHDGPSPAGAGEDVTTLAGQRERQAALEGRRSEAWHRAGRTGTLRAAIFGVNDGLVSNLALVMGVTGATANNEVVVLTGIAGLLAGAFSMGAGEWISMQSQRELFERQIAL
ncbi:MAG: VIT1/CCC1 transporter family protein, partial [Chloroflexota bacterium]|nr:VIT1/CCC1 transporter family protein [Chloroflexota bacterium]